MNERKRHHAVQIFGTEIHDSALEKARAGVYAEAIESEISAERLRRFLSNPAVSVEELYKPIAQELLERARAQDLTHKVEAARQNEQLRTTLIDAMAHEFKTPLTSIKAATTSLIASPDQPPESRAELLKIADE